VNGICKLHSTTSNLGISPTHTDITYNIIAINYMYVEANR